MNPKLQKASAWLGMALAIALFSGCTYVPDDQGSVGSTEKDSSAETVKAESHVRPVVQPPKSPDENFTVDFLRTGKSDCVLIRMDGKVILSDTADSDDFELICQQLNGYGIKKIDYMILSHLDNDHIGSAAMLVRKYDVDIVYQPDYERDSKLYANLKQAINSTDTKLCPVVGDLTLETEQGSILISPPLASDYEGDNDYSLITTITYKKWSMLLMGDAEKTRITEFAPLAAAHYDLIKLPHHGDWNKGLSNFLKDTEADAYVVCAADLSTVEAGLTAFLVDDPVYYTFDGAIHVAVDETNIYVY